MKSYFVFSDECGQYKRDRGKSFLKAHPFYVRSTVMVDTEDYIKINDIVDQKKKEYSIPIEQEIKWAHLGSLIKKNPPDYLKGYGVDKFKKCIYEIICSILECSSVILFFTLTDNREANRVDSVKMIKMHLQNMLQRAQHEMDQKNGYAIIIVDDLNENSKPLKKACYSLMEEGDFVTYKNIRKSILIDFSEQCAGLQFADLCAGVFTASLKYFKNNEDIRFEYALDLLKNFLFKKIRSLSLGFCNHEVYGFGIREVPDNAGKSIAKKISKITSDCLNSYEYEEMQKAFEDFNGHE